MFNMSALMGGGGMLPQKKAGGLFGVPFAGMGGGNSGGMTGVNPVRDMPIAPMQMRRMMQAGGMPQRGNPNFGGDIVNTAPTMSAQPMQGAPMQTPSSGGMPMDKMKMQMLISQLMAPNKQF
jgi:hypothetical protein